LALIHPPLDVFFDPSVVFIHLQLTLGRVVERHWDHVRLRYDLPNNMTLAKKIVTSSVFSLTKILVIEDHKLDSTFVHVTFRSQNLLKATSDETKFNTN
jgi:hypothetical protein